MSAATLTEETKAAEISGRIERLPYFGFHTRARVIVGTATLFDAFDAISIAYVLPVLVPLFDIAPGEIGLLISAGYLGQIAGALLFGWVAERFGRRTALIWAVGIFGLMSFGAALSSSYGTLFLFRTLQGVGLGGEVPIAATYINEIYKAKGRGRFVLLYETLFGVGIFLSALLGFFLVPNVGWQAMFYIGGIPSLLILAVYRYIPESPRWLAHHGRLEEAEKIVAQWENEASRGGSRPLPEPEPTPPIATRRTRWQELLQGVYLRRTLVVWVMWFAAYFAGYGISTWLPTLYTSVYGMGLTDALALSLATSGATIVGAVVVALLIDRTGRRAWFTGAFLVGAVLLLVLWTLGASSAAQVAIIATLSYLAFGTVNLGLYLYTPEIYPTRMRALGSGVATTWLRVASAIGPLVTGAVVAAESIETAFLIFGVVLLVAALVVGAFGTETKNLALEEVSP